MSDITPDSGPTEHSSDDDRGIANRQAFNEGWGETIERINEARQRGEGWFGLPKASEDRHDA